MGDLNAVEFAHLAHMSMAAEAGAISDEQLISLNSPIPQTPYRSDIILDDHVALQEEPASVPFCRAQPLGPELSTLPPAAGGIAASSRHCAQKNNNSDQLWSKELAAVPFPKLSFKTEAEDKISSLLSTYTSNGLLAHPEKAVHRAFSGQFWGAQFDGTRGTLRASTLR